jgi:hypothetical protein
VSWFSKVGDAFNWAKDTAAPIGAGLTAAQHAVDSNPVTGALDNAINPVHALFSNQASGAVADQGLNALSFGYNKVVAPAVSSYEQLANTPDMYTLDGWRNAWSRANGTEDQPGISPGQANIIGIRGGFGDKTPGVGTYDMSPEALKNRADFFQNTWQGKVSSGALDLAMNLTLDPTALAGKYGKAAALARNTFRDVSEVDRVLQVNAGASAATRRETNLSNRMTGFFKEIRGLSPAEIALHPVVKQSDQSGAFAYMFGRANQEFAHDEVALGAAQRNIFGAMLGNQNSIGALKDQHALLANELQRLSDTPIPSKAAADFTWADHGRNMYAVANAEVPPEIEAQKTEIERELARLEAAVSGSGSVNRVAGTLWEQNTYGNQLTHVRGSTLNTGLGNMPIRVIGGLVANRLPGHVSTVDPVSGFEDLRNTLAQSKHLTGEQRRGLLDNYVNAATQGDRQKAVYDAEGAIVHATAGAYGLSPEQARKLAEAGNGRRQAILSSLSSRLYSAAPGDKFVHHVDPEEGEITAISTPLLKSQIEDNVGIIDPRQLDAALKEAKQSRLLERVTGQIGDDARNLATSAYDTVGSAQMLASDLLGKFTRLWKDSALMRLAYPMRIQIDSQLRMAVHMDTLSHLGALGSGLKAEGKYLLSVPGSDKLSLRNILNTPKGFLQGKGVFKEGDLERSVTDIVRGAGVHEDDIATVVRNVMAKDGGIADLATSLTDAQLARYRATGEWGYVDQANPAWAQAWTRAVNRQIRNSPTAMKAAEGATKDELKTFVRTDAAARQEWLNLKSSNGGDIDAWLHNVQAHVDHYLPTAEQKSTVLEREVNDKDVEGWFANQDDRMRVHGESYAPTTKSALGDWYEKSRNSWYKFASEAPETAMARAPLYSYAFKRHLGEVIDRHGDGPIDGAMMDQYRRTADRLARREVGKILYDTSHTSNLASHFRYVSPFFAAWEDMVKKWGGLFYDKPQKMVRFNQAWHAPNQAGVVVDENGNQVDADGNRFDPNTGRKLDPVKDKYLIGKRELATVPVWLMPKRMRDAIGIGDLDAATSRKRAASLFSIDKNSFNIVFQGDPVWLPGFGPLVQIPVNEMVKSGMIKNTDSPLVQALLPMGVNDADWKDQVLPSWARNAKNAFFQDGQEYANTRAMLLAQETDRWHNGERKTKPSGEEIDNMARNWFILKAATAFASPVSMQPTAKTQFYIDQAHIYKQKYARPQGLLNQYIQQYGLEQGKAKFEVEHPDWKSQYLKDFPQWFEMSLSMSDNQTGIVATDNAVDIARTPFVQKMVRDNPDYGWYFVGAANQYGNTPGSAFSQTAYAQQESMGLRGQAKPEDALAKVEAIQGLDAVPDRHDQAQPNPEQPWSALLPAEGRRRPQGVQGELPAVPDDQQRVLEEGLPEHGPGEDLQLPGRRQQGHGGQLDVRQATTERRTWAVHAGPSGGAEDPIQPPGQEP